MTVSTRTAPNYTTQSAAAYKANIDGALAVDARLAGYFAPHQQDVGSPAPDMSMRVDAGFVFTGGSLTEVSAQTVSGFTTPASGYVRIDRVVVDAATGAASRIAGTAETVGSPTAVAPSIPAGKLACCQISFTDSDTVITNSMITDERTFSAGSTAPTVTTIASGSGTYTTPTGCTRIVVEAWGGGGSGGGGASSAYRGSGGGAGAYCKKTITSPSASYSYSVGAGGAAVGSGSGGNAGGNTTFGSLTANGGGAGSGATGGAVAGAPGGTATGGDENIQGGGSDTQNSSTGQYNSAGGDAPRGGFGGKTNVATDGQVPGGGGACANFTGNSGAGAAGAIIVHEFYD